MCRRRNASVVNPKNSHDRSWYHSSKKFVPQRSTTRAYTLFVWAQKQVCVPLSRSTTCIIIRCMSTERGYNVRYASTNRIFTFYYTQNNMSQDLISWCRNQEPRDVLMFCINNDKNLTLFLKAGFAQNLLTKFWNSVVNMIRELHTQRKIPILYFINSQAIFEIGLG